MTTNSPKTQPGQCPRCSRPVLAPQHRKCMYCGARLPAELILPETEAQAVIREKNERWRADREAADRLREQRERKKTRRRKDEASDAEFLLGVMAEHHAKSSTAPTDTTAGAKPKERGDARASARTPTPKSTPE